LPPLKNSAHIFSRFSGEELWEQSFSVVEELLESWCIFGIQALENYGWIERMIRRERERTIFGHSRA
jgi:hypothetical protein